MDIIEEICNCQNCNLYKNQLPLTDKLHKSNVMWVGLSAKKVKNISEDYPLKENTNSSKIIKTIEERNNEFKYYKANLVKCLPLNENGNIRYPNKIEMEICIKNLLIEIEKVQPKIIFLLGNIVNDFVIKFLKNNNIILDAKIVKIEHPSYIYIYKKNNIEEYINKVSKIINNM